MTRNAPLRIHFLISLDWFKGTFFFYRKPWFSLLFTAQETDGFPAEVLPEKPKGSDDSLLTISQKSSNSLDQVPASTRLGFRRDRVRAVAWSTGFLVLGGIRHLTH